MTPLPEPAPRRRRRSTAWLLAVVGAALLGVLLTGAGVLHAKGWRGFDITTASMGVAAPVGTLVITAPVSVGQLGVGDMVTYRAPGSERVFTHRVIEVSPDGTFRTRGDLNGAPDPWSLHEGDLVGQVTLRIWAGGYLLRALPILSIGWLAVWLLGRAIRRVDWRAPTRILGTTLVVGVAAWVVRPLLGVSAVSYSPDAIGTGTQATVVSTGILPIRVAALHGSHIDLQAGQLGVVRSTAVNALGVHQFDPSPHFGPWWWVAVVLACLTPLLWCLIVGLPASQPSAPRPPHRPAGPDEPDWPDGPSAPCWFPGLGWAGGTAAVVVLTVTGASSVAPVSQAAFTARVTNTTSSAGSRTWFTCTAAEKGTAGAFLAYAMGDPVGSTTAADLTTNARTGTYSGTITHPVSTTCPRDSTTAAGFNGTNSCLINATSAQAGTNVFTVELWFKTTVAGGKLVGFGNTTTTGSTETSYDRHLYLDNTGRLLFGVRSGTVRTVVASTATYLDGTWHHAAATLSGAGMFLYVDGAPVISDPATTTAQAFTGNWRFGCGKLTGWTAAPTNFFYTGTLAYGAVYTTALSEAQIREHYLAGSP